MVNKTNLDDCSNNVKNQTCTIIKRLLKFIGEVIGAYTIIAIFLSVLSICPYLYTYATKWANQTPLPSVTTCKIAKYKEVGNNNWYNVKLHFKKNDYFVSKRVAIFIEPIDETIYISSLQDIDNGPINPELPNYIFKQNFPSSIKSFSFKALTNSKSDLLKLDAGKSLTEDECPFKIKVYGENI